MEEHIREKIKDKMVATVEHLHKLKAEKAAFLSSANEQIRGADKRIKAFSECLKLGDITILNDVLDEYEFADLTGAQKLFEE